MKVTVSALYYSLYIMKQNYSCEFIISISLASNLYLRKPYNFSVSEVYNCKVMQEAYSFVSHSLYWYTSDNVVADGALLSAVCVSVGYLMSYWNLSFFPVACADAILYDKVTYDTMARISGSSAGIAQALKVIVDNFGWKHIVVLSDEDTSAICWHFTNPMDEIIGQDKNYSFTWFRLGSNPTDKQLDDVLQQIRSRARGFDFLPAHKCYFHIFYSVVNGNAKNHNKSTCRLCIGVLLICAIFSSTAQKLCFMEVENGGFSLLPVHYVSESENAKLLNNRTPFV